ncbi:MAG: polyprenyl synthetase family protein [Gemmatimonadota bacterium]|nr:MAG: polyprenyl synthetase family protein [Gemmatimonadota bacterium]
MKDIIFPIREELEGTKRVLKETLASEVALVSEMAQYIVALKGKFLRPILVLLSTKVCGNVPDEAMRAAAGLELIHVATLIHDDVVDESEMRRGELSVHSIWSSRASILMGDYLLSHAFSLFVGIRSQLILDILARATVRLSSGEIHQIQQSEGLETAEEIYFKVIADKTASLFAAGCEMGPILAEGDTHLRRTMAEFGENLGLAFQITDDILDFEGTEKETGKPSGSDLRGKHLTLPLIRALETASQSEARKIKALIEKEIDTRGWEHVRSFIRTHGGLEYAASKAKEYAQRAAALVKGLDDSPAKSALMNLVSLSVHRRR